MSSITLSERDLSRLQEAIRTLASPLDHPSVDGWRRAVNRCLKPLLGADKATFQFPGQGEEDLICEEMDPDTLRRYMPVVRRLQKRLWNDPAAVFRRVVELGVCDRATLYRHDLDRYYASEYYNEYIRPQRAFDGLMAAVPLPDRPEPVQLYFHHDTPHGGRFEPRARRILRLLHPAFEAGVRAQLALGAERARIGAAIDAVDDGAVLFALDGRILHRNPAASAILDADPESERVLSCARVVAAACGAVLPGPGRSRRATRGTQTTQAGGEPVSRTVRTALGPWRLRASLVAAGPRSRPLVLVLITAGKRALPQRTAVMRRFALTDRQAEVALFLARRRSNREIADALSISPHTARHHTEIVLRKLGVPSRRDVARALTEALPESRRGGDRM